MMNHVTETIRQLADEIITDISEASGDDTIAPDVVTHMFRACVDGELDDIFMAQLEKSYLGVLEVEKQRRERKTRKIKLK